MIKDPFGYLREFRNARRYCLCTALADLNVVTFVSAVPVADAKDVQFTGRGDQFNLAPVAKGRNGDFEQL